ncbi:CO dehydrogenase/acetyl-CoA synthase delta subunit [Paraburkholderia youngii]
MKMSQRMQSDSAGPVWGLITGIFLMVAGIGIWDLCEIIGTRQFP